MPDPPLRLRRPVHPLAREAFAALARLGQGVLGEAPERVYFSRAAIPRRPLRNEPEIEALFAEHGFEIVRPETHPFETQVALARGAKLIAGPAGSAMHLAALAPPSTRLLILCSPNSFELTECFLNPVAGRLGLVFGRAETGDRWAPWRIAPSDVAAGIAGHFALGRVAQVRA